MWDTPCHSLLSSVALLVQVLDVGSGSGYLSVIFAYLVQAAEGQPAGRVVGVDIIQDLVERSGKSAQQVSFAEPMLSKGDLSFHLVRPCSCGGSVALCCASLCAEVPVQCTDCSLGTTLFNV